MRMQGSKHRDQFSRHRKSRGRDLKAGFKLCWQVVLKPKTRSHHQMERVERSQAGGRLKGDAV